MQILRIVSVQVIDSSNIDVKFTHNLTTKLVTSNVSIISDTPNVSDSNIHTIKVIGSVLSIVCQPLAQFASYSIKFQSVDQYPFISVNGTAKIFEDGVSNKYSIVGPLEPNNPIRNFLDSYFKDNIYNHEDDQSLISKYIDSLSTTLARALFDIRQVKNENYLSFTIGDESHTRGAGPTDRLFEESAYEIIRVGKTKSGTNANSTLNFDVFPTYPVTLQKQDNIDTLSVGSINEPGKFNINTFVLNMNSSPITKVNSIVFTLSTMNPIYTYDIQTLGYQIKDSKYDSDFGFTYQLLENNQIKINDLILSDPNFSLENILKIEVNYESKNLGRIINKDISLYTTANIIREVLPPIINVFNLSKAPITDADNNIPIIGGVTFFNPNSNIEQHPAFLNEIPFRLNGLPFLPGQYSIDYNTGTVYVYGSDLNNDGTGPTPPLATYKYRYIYKSDQDYTFDSDSFDVVALPYGNLIEATGNINFNYEDVLIPGIDYEAKLHKEVLNERVNNSLGALNVLKTKNSPITNVFQIFNETSGEIYTLDRWNGDHVYFRYNNPPTIKQQLAERVSFENITNEMLFVNTTTTNISNLRIFKIFLRNNSIISSTEDSIGTSFNTSLVFSKTDIFVNEKWFNRELNESENLDKLQNIGEYIVDYINGIVYCAVDTTQEFDIGSASYKKSFILLQYPHIISVDDIYYRISNLNPKNKLFAYTTFSDGLVEPATVNYSDELYLNSDSTAPYQLFNNEVGIFLSSDFLNGVTNQVKFIRSIFEYDDLSNSINPLNFANVSTYSGFNIQINPITKQFYDNVKFDGYDYYVNINENIPYISSNITYTFSVIRLSDGMPLWDLTGTIVPGNPVKLILPGIFSPAIDDAVNITYTFTVNDLSRLVIDYNKGDYFIDYTYIADEILVSYEYGDNVIDFRNSNTVSKNENYFVSYKAGALRDALVRNFGTLVNVKGLADIDLEFDRERYRDALTAALTSFIQGPTLNAIKNIGKTISHIEPEIKESILQNWSLSSSLLHPQSITTTGEFQLLPAKFGNGVLVNSSEQSITLPLNSNFRLEEGTFETWIVPQWNGLDNDADLTFDIKENGATIDPSRVFVGASGQHPVIVNGTFSLNKLSDVEGLPNKNTDGVFIYYDNDSSGNFKRWYVEIMDGYVNPTSSNYKFKITSNGTFYDTKSIVLPKPSNLTIFTGTNSINFSINGPSAIDMGITFISDYDHYILDFGESIGKNRLSIFKDVSGYINFKVIDKDKITFSISADVSSWKAGETHHVAASWKLNTYNKDEMHLFIDGFEVPNIIKYGQNLKPYLHEKFRTINSEEIIGLIDRDIVASTDLNITSGSPTVSSSINFSNYQISIGDTIFIDEFGFEEAGYTILSINGQSLLLDTNMPTTLTNGRFSINRTQFTVTSDIDTASNIAVFTINPITSGSDINCVIGSNVVTSISTNFSTLDIKPGFLLRIDNISLNTTYTILQVSNNTLVIDDYLPVNIVNETFRVYSNSENEIPGIRAVNPSYSISKDVNFNNILTVSNNVSAGDLLIIRTFGLNSRRVKKEYYVWSNNEENILRTKLPAPIALDEVKITKIILPITSIGDSNSTMISGVWESNQLATYQPSNSQDGRTISVVLSGNNVDFSDPVDITINGITNGSTVDETITFTDYGTLDFANLYTYINYITVSVRPINSNKNAVSLQVREKYSITHGESSSIVPVIKYSYQINSGYSLYRDSLNSVRDDSNLFSSFNIGNYLLINSPLDWSGFYLITDISEDRKSLIIEPTNNIISLPASYFSGAQYQILNVNDYRSGLQNGLFTFEISESPGTPYLLLNGSYEFNYSTYARIKLDPLSKPIYIGSDLNSSKQANAIIDETKIYSIMLTDTRIGENIPSNQRSITKDFNSLKPLKSDSTTLVLITFDSIPFTNDASFYITPSSVNNFFQSSIVVNENFGNSLVFLNKPLIISNDGILNTKKEGTIEFWVNPLFDSTNDPVDRFYFDAYGAVIEEVVSVDNTSLKLSSPTNKILSVKLKSGDSQIDYFSGGKIEIDTQRAIQEESVSISNNTVTVSQPILQVSTVKIIGDLSGVDYFVNGAISSDKKTIYLGKLLPVDNLPLIVTYQTTNNNNEKLNTQIIRLNKKLPYQKSTVLVNYIPNGLQGDRISIFKDKVGYINFAITASNIDYVVSAPTRWSKGTWHRVKASYKINGNTGSDELKLFIDGYEYNTITFGTGLVFGSFPIVMGATIIGDGYGFNSNIKFKDSINNLFIGTQYNGQSPIFSLIDNFRISSISRPVYAPYGEPIDVNYNSNIDMVFPVTKDLYTTYLMDFDSIKIINDDFAIIKNRSTGLFDFYVNIFDSFGIVNGNIKSKETLEKLIKILKPANSRAFISYVK